MKQEVASLKLGSRNRYRLGKPQEGVRLNRRDEKVKSSLPAVLDISHLITSKRGELAEILLVI
jgi:hypothetical protein